MWKNGILVRKYGAKQAGVMYVIPDSMNLNVLFSSFVGCFYFIRDSVCVFRLV